MITIKLLGKGFALVKENKIPVEAEDDFQEAARAMGRKGGTIRSEKKLASANIMKAVGKKKGKKYPGMYDPERGASTSSGMMHGRHGGLGLIKDFLLFGPWSILWPNRP